MDTEKPRAKAGLLCPFHRKEMAKVCHHCPLWVKVTGKHPQHDTTVDHWDCSLAWLPILTIENSQMQRQTGAAVESFRNAMVELNARPLALETAWPEPRLPAPAPARSSSPSAGAAGQGREDGRSQG